MIFSSRFFKRFQSSSPYFLSCVGLMIILLHENKKNTFLLPTQSALSTVRVRIFISKTYLTSNLYRCLSHYYLTTNIHDSNNTIYNNILSLKMVSSWLRLFQLQLQGNLCFELKRLNVSYIWKDGISVCNNGSYKY